MEEDAASPCQSQPLMRCFRVCLQYRHYTKFRGFAHGISLPTGRGLQVAPSVMEAQCHCLLTQNITGLPAKPAGISKLEGISELLAQHFMEYIQLSAIKRNI